MGKIRVFIKEFNCFGYECTIDCTVDNVGLFLSVLSKEQLELLLKTQIEEENYEMASEIHKRLNK